MSHFKQRKETNCLNCNAEVIGKYCHVCGQENIEPKETFWHLVTHFVYDIVHFDGKFFSTVRYLLLKPGFLSTQYIIGRRMTYLNPIRMYVFISAFFFLFFFSGHPDQLHLRDNKGNELSALTLKKDIRDDLKDLKDSLANPKKLKNLDSNKINKRMKLLNEDLSVLEHDTTNLLKLHYIEDDSDAFALDTYKSHSQYDSLQKTLSAGKRDNWFKRKFYHKTIDLNDAYKREHADLLHKISENFLHSFPQMFFVSLPLVALLLRLLYVRRKNYFYVDHVIYTIHLYCAIFILLFLATAISRIDKFSYLRWTHILEYPIALYMAWYVYKSLRNFYRQRRAKTIFKLILLLLMAIFIMMLLFTVFIVLTLLSVK